MKSLRKYFGGIILAILCYLFWYNGLRSTSKFTYYELRGCPGIYLTQIEYSTLTDRGVIFIRGRYEGESLPDSDFIKYPGLTGFDSIMEVVATCTEKEDIALYYNGGYYVKVGNPQGISPIRLRFKEYDKIMHDVNSTVIVCE